MAVKYILQFADYADQTCIATISHQSYTGQPIPIRGVGKQAVILERDCGDDPYEPIVNTKATLNVYQEEHAPIDVFELQTAKDREFSVTFTIAGQVKFKGWLNPDGLQQPYAGAPFALQLTATDGLMLLQDIPYIHNNLPGGQCIINYIRQILLAPSNLGSDLPVQWYNKVVNMEYPGEDVMSGSVRWSTRGEGYNDYNGTLKDCMYILEGMLRSMQMRIVQVDGLWTIYRINDMIDDAGGYVGFKNLTGLDTFEIMNSDYFVPLQSISDDRDNFKVTQNDGTFMNKPAFKRVVTKYEQSQRDNILPNGNMDLWFQGSPLYWELLSDGTATYEQFNSLSAQTGNSIKISNFGSANATLQLSLGALPIDTDILYSYINFGFTFSILAGAVVNADQIIQWGDNGKLVLNIYYIAGDGVFYYLNQFGFWQANAVDIKPEIPNLKMGDVAQVDFNAHQDIKIPLPVTEIGRTTYPEINVRFFIQNNVVIAFDDIYVNTDSNSDVYEAVYEDGTTNTAKEDYTLTISSSHNGFYTSNYMTSYAASGREKFYDDGISQGTLTELHSRAVLRNRYKPSLVFEGSMYGSEYSYNQMYAIRGLDDKRFLPLASSWNTETNTVRLTCIESRNDVIPISVSHYGSNDKTKLSN